MIPILSGRSVAIVYQKENKEKQHRHQKHGWRSTSSGWRKNCKTIHRYARFVQKCKEEIEFDEKAEIYWASITPTLQKMVNQLEELGTPPSLKATKECILYCIKLYSIVSTAQDALDGELQIVPAKKRDAGNAFNTILNYAGRHKPDDMRKDDNHGLVPYWNTTQKGEEITCDNIFFGPDIGLPKKSATYWLKLSKSKKVYITEYTKYEKGGILTKEKTTWATDAIVKTGVYRFNRIISENLQAQLEELLK